MTHTLITELNDNWHDYSWTCMGIFTDETGALLWADDSGCSCNGPWEYDTVYFPLNRETWGEFLKCVDGFPADDADKAVFLVAAMDAVSSKG